MAGHRGSPAGQLDLALGEPPRPRLPPRIVPMLAADGGAPFEDEGWFFEPWWPGSPAVAFVEDGRLRMTMEHLADPLTAFPELGVIPAQLAADGVSLVGTLLLLDGNGRPDRELLRRRLVEPAVRTGTGAFVAADLLHLGGESLAAWPFAQRRAKLLEVLADGEHCVVSRGLRGEGLTLADAAASMGLDAISARRLSARWHPGPAPEDYLRLPVLAPPAPETRPLLVLLQRLPLDA